MSSTMPPERARTGETPAAMPAGLRAAEAASRLKADGPNALPQPRPRTLARIVLEVLREPMLLLLVLSVVVYALIGDWRESLALLVSVFAVLAITIGQSHRTERALAALRELYSPRALVLRDGQLQRIPSAQVVRGDLIRLEEGDRVPADARVWQANDLRVDESLLTGESVPVDKAVSDGSEPIGLPGGDHQPFVFAGTLVVQGQGLAEVLRIGADTGMGRIGKVLGGIRAESTPLQADLGRTVRLFGAGAFALCALVVLIHGLWRGDWFDGVMQGITLGMAVIPEEFPVVLTVFLALGAWRISSHGVLTRRASAIETLGAATVLCVDKTGTLTLNRMRVASLDTDGVPMPIDDDVTLTPAQRQLLELGTLACEVDPHDPMERAFHEACAVRGLCPGATLQLTREYPIRPGFLVHGHGWIGTDARLLTVKGAPEAVAQACGMDAAGRAALSQRVDALARQGLRVLGIAHRRLGEADWPSDLADARLVFAGLLGLADPIRPDVPGAVSQCHEAGIRVVMVTGDYPVTAQAIGRQAGLHRIEEPVLGAEIAGLAPPALRALARRSDIFARITPEQKLGLVRALQADGQVVAMTGDGVNDAPALQAAHIGVAMGRRGSDVAREAASLVLLDDAFAALVDAIREGRRIYANLRHAFAYLVAVHVPTAMVVLVSLLFGWPLVLFPLHVAFMELVIDPACSIAFESEPAAPDLMRSPPRDPAQRLFDQTGLLASLLQGASVAVVTLAAFAWTLADGASEGRARALAFAMLVLGNLALIVANRSGRRTAAQMLRVRNPVLRWVFGITLAALLVVLYVEPIARVFRFEHLPPLWLAGSALLIVASLSWIDLYKWLTHRGTP